MLVSTSVLKSTRILSTVAVAALLAGCSSTIDRFMAGRKNVSDADPVYTASVPKPTRASLIGNATPAVPQDQIASAPLQQQPKLAYNYAGAKKSKLNMTAADDSQPLMDQQPQTADAIDQAQPRSVAVAAAPVKSGKLRVERGMTLYSIADANDVNMKSIARFNGLRAPYRIVEGQILRIPGKTRVVSPHTTLAAQKKQIEHDAPATSLVADATPEQATPVAVPGTYTVKSGDTLYSLGRSFKLAPGDIAEANGIALNSKLALGQALKMPGGKDTAGEQTAELSPPAAVQVEPAPQESAAQVSQVPAIPDSTKPSLDATQVKPVQQAQGDQPTSDIMAGMSLRWPVRGKIISEFGNKPGGLKNEGINIAVPEGTSVRAAEKGVVAYAGNELKGYGNLVLIRHDGGYVTAYAHAKELFVKKGDTINRGDVIAKAGQTGAVSSPQLHFEVRKGATALDPVGFLNSSTASN